MRIITETGKLHQTALFIAQCRGCITSAPDQGLTCLSVASSPVHAPGRVCAMLQLHMQMSSAVRECLTYHRYAASLFASDCRIIAGPGSGKTRVLTSRVEYLIKEKGCKPWEMVVITFSNKAARELQDRLAVLLGQELASQVIAGFLHPFNPHLATIPPSSVKRAEYGMLLSQVLQAACAIVSMLGVHAHNLQAACDKVPMLSVAKTDLMCCTSLTTSLQTVLVHLTLLASTREGYEVQAAA